VHFFVAARHARAQFQAIQRALARQVLLLILLAT
jgi:hypothetical protein